MSDKIRKDDDDNGDRSDNNETTPCTTTGRPLRVVFLHLDWGIGGAEQLMLQLATACVELGHSVQLVTSRCEPHHCFSQLKPGTGAFYPYLKVYGTWIPQDLFGQLRAVCSTFRLLYLSWKLSSPKSRNEPKPDVVVLDVLPTPLPLLQNWIPTASLLFYCHFPDQLLASSSKSLYRRVIDGIENITLPYADNIVVNSQFTQQTVLNTFASLRRQQGAETNLPVLYPALDTSALDQPEDSYRDSFPAFTKKPIVSLNRYERKKNLKLLLQAVRWVHEHHPKVELPTVVIAGGYDVKNIENVEYRGELQQYVEQHNLQDWVQFRQSISDAERTWLLKQALCVVYTPTNEHFGIVPLEAMYCESPVVAVNTGGPTETVQHEKTGYLCDPTPQAFGQALLQLVQHPEKAEEMGNAGRQHVLSTFGQDRLRQEWNRLVNLTVQKGRVRQEQYYRTYALLSTLTAILDAVLTLLFVWMLTRLLQYAGILHSSESIIAAVKRVWKGGNEEL